MVEIKLSEEFLEDFSRIEKRAEGGNGEAAYLLKIMNKGIAKLSSNHESGQRIQRPLWPDYYKRKYDVTNLWRLRLDDCWRMIYTMRGDQICIFAMILDVLDHKIYDRRFGYR